MGEHLEVRAADGTVVRRVPIMTFAEAMAEPAHGAVGDTEGVEDVVCRRVHGMSAAEYRALPDDAGE